MSANKACVLILAALCAGAGCRALVKGEDDFRRNAFLAYWHGPESNFIAHEKLERAAARVIGDENRRDTMRLNNLAVAYTRLLQFEKARDAFRACLKRKPLVLRPYLNYAEFERLLGRPARARAILGEMARRPDLDAGLLLAAADAAESRGGAEIGVLLAETLYAVGASGASKNTRLESALWLGRWYLAVPDHERAAKWFDRVLTLDPNRGDALYGMGSIAYLAGDHGRAVRFLEPALKSGGKQKPLRFLLARSLYKKNRVEDALRVLNSTPAQSMQNDFRLLELRGKLLLLRDWRTNPERLLVGVQSPAMRKRLLRSWFGNTAPADIRKTRREFELMY